MTSDPLSTTVTNSRAQLTTHLLVRSLSKHWLLGSVVALVVLAATVFYTMGQRRLYRSTVVLQIDPNPPRPLGSQVQAVVDMGSGSYWNNKEYFTTQQRILEGRTIAKEAARLLNLQSDPGFMQNRLNAPRTGKPADLDDATSTLMSRLTVESVRETRLLNVSLIDVDPQRARRILATFAEVYLQRNVDVVVTSSGAASEWLRDQVDKLKDDLQSSELALHEYKKDKQILSVSLDDQSSMLRGEMQQLNEAVTRANAKRLEISARLRELEKVNAEDPSELPAMELLSNAVLSNLRQSYIQSKSELSALLAGGKGSMHPLVEASRAKVDTTREALMDEVRNIQGAIRGDLNAVTKELQGLQGLFSGAKQKAMDLNMLEIEFRRLERTKMNTEKLYSLVLERSKESDLTSIMRFNNISIIEPPVVPRGPFKPRVPMNLAMGLAAGLMLGFVVALGREIFDQTIRSPQDLQAEVDAPFLGIMPIVNSGSSKANYYSHSRHRSKRRPQDNPADVLPELLVHELPGSNVAECARSIRTSLTFASPDRPFRRILVSSGSPGEGKTTIACAIAIAFAQAGQKVLLIDCDLRRPRLHRIMGLDNSVGLTTMLQESGTQLSGVRETRVPNLTLITAGPHVPNPAEVVQSDAFGRFLDVLGERYDRIILDSPPILAVTDASVISSRVDTTLLVIRAGKSRRDALKQVIGKLRELGVPLVGTVLNAMDPNRSTGSYYYYYNYKYHGYGNGYNSSNGASV